ncbi:MAG: metallophosphoesterase [Planctomycetaceae bacterium]|nr:metallophosphoesterase [Planctomycetaceae bacterium]
MDTTPFHFILIALDVFLCSGLYFWLRFRRNTLPDRSAVRDFERHLFVPQTHFRKPSLLWDISGVILFGGFGICVFAFLSRLIFTDYVQNRVYYFNVGQCIVEGAVYHGTFMLLMTALLLRRNRRGKCAVTALIAAVMLAGFGFDILYREPYLLKVEYYEIRSEKITQPLRIVFVADIQTDRIGSHERRTLQKIQQQEADLIILGGDYIQTYRGTREKHLPEKFRQLLLDYPLQAPLGVYAVAGNIGSRIGDARLFQGTGVEFVPDTKVFENLGAKESDPENGIGPIDLILLSLSDSIGNLEKRGYTDRRNFLVMVGHYPNYAADGFTYKGKLIPGYRKAEHAPDLMLAGHTHGCQIVIPFYGPYPYGGDHFVRQTPPHLRLGFHEYPNGGHLLVSRGSGMERGWAPRIRFCCPSEISVIDLVPKPQSKPK